MSTTKEESERKSAELKDDEVVEEGEKKRGKLKDDEVAEETANTPVTVKFNDAVYTTTKERLLGRDQDSFFHLRFSGRWKQGNVVEVNDRCGETFADVLYYLRFGDIPRDPATRKSLLPAEQLAKLEVDAEFYLLPGLEKLCSAGPPPLFVVTEFCCDSSKHPHVKVTQFTSYETARSFYDNRTRGMVQEDYQVEQGDYYTDKRSIDDKTGLEELEIWCDGNWKRPFGYALKILHNNDPIEKGVCMQYNVRAWPDVYDY